MKPSPLISSFFNQNDLVEVSELGSGRFGKTILYRNKNTNCFFAGKVYNYSIHNKYEENNFTDWFLYNIEIQSHPSILPLKGLLLYHNFSDPSVVTFSDYQEGGCLKNNLSASWMDPTTQMKMIIGIAEGMRFLHQNKISHGCLYPSNILLNDKHEPLLTGFGSPDLCPSLTNEEYCQYLDPNSSDDYKSDIFSFGFLVFSISTKCLPFPEESTSRVIRKIKQGIRPFMPPEIIPEELMQIIEESWNIDLSKRPRFDFICERLKNKASYLAGADEEAIEEYRSQFYSK